MSYEKQGFMNGAKLKAEQLNHIEDGIAELEAALQEGVSIASIVQTTTATEDGGTNVITVTLTDGTTSTFRVKNGSKGSTGAPGAAGTSVSVSKVSQSNADGGSNVVTFSDGQTVTIKNGSKGSAGVAGVSVVSVEIAEV